MAYTYDAVVKDLVAKRPGDWARFLGLHADALDASAARFGKHVAFAHSFDLFHFGVEIDGH